MSDRYKVQDGRWPHFITFTVNDWVDVFTRNRYKDILVDSMNWCIESKGLRVFAWVIMTNHIHLIAASEGEALEDIIRDMKKFTAKRILEDIRLNSMESRDWMMRHFIKGKNEKTGKDEHHFWQQGYHSIHLWKSELIAARLNYVHENPVRAGFVNASYEWRYSSAIDYAGNQGLVKIELIDAFVSP